MPAGAFQTPRWPSVRAITPAIAPDGGYVSRFPCSSRSSRRGKYRAAFFALSPLTPVLAAPVTALPTSVQPVGESTRKIARWSRQNFAASSRKLRSFFEGMQSRLKRRLPSLRRE